MRSYQFGAQLRQSRVAAGLTQSGLSEALGHCGVSVSVATIDAWEGGDWASADVRTFEALRIALGFHPVWPNVPA